MIEGDKSPTVIEVISNKILCLKREAVDNLLLCLNYFVSLWAATNVVISPGLMLCFTCVSLKDLI